MSLAQILEEKIASRSAKVAVVGVGYVGLPLAVEVAAAGFEVFCIDVSAEKMKQLSEGHSYIADVPSARVAPLVQEGRLHATTDFDTLKDMDCVSICVPTPLSKTKDPDMSMILDVAAELQTRLKPGTLVILESTTYPGTTREIFLPKLSEKGLKVGEDFFLAFSPERVDPGNPIYHTKNTPKIIGGTTPTCTHVARKLYSHFIDTIVPVSSTDAAEMVKLLENTFRAVNIGLVNEVAIMCQRLGINTWEVIDAAATKPFGFMPFYPGPGLGGHCIPIDPLYLSWKLKTLKYHARFIELADEINGSMPAFVVQRVQDALNDSSKAVRGARVLVLGVAYKKDIDDVRESPALDVIEILQEKGAKVAYYDPYIPSIRLPHETLHSLESVAGGEGFDIAVITTNHNCFNYQELLSNIPVVVDSRNALKGQSFAQNRIYTL